MLYPANIHISQIVLFHHFIPSHPCSEEVLYIGKNQQFSFLTLHIHNILWQLVLCPLYLEGNKQLEGKVWFMGSSSASRIVNDCCGRSSSYRECLVTRCVPAGALFSFSRAITSLRFKNQLLKSYDSQLLNPIRYSKSNRSILLLGEINVDIPFFGYIIQMISS